MEEISKKRKERQTSSDLDILQDRGRKFKQTVDYKELSSESDADLEFDRNRTPSGTVLPNKVNDIQTFFLAKARKLSGESEKALKVNSQQEACSDSAIISQPWKPLNQRTIKRKKRKQGQQVRKECKQKHQSADAFTDRDNSELTGTTDESTSEADEREILHILSGQLQQHIDHQSNTDAMANIKARTGTANSLEKVVDKQIATIEEAMDTEGNNPQVMHQQYQQYYRCSKKLRKKSKTLANKHLHQIR